MKNDSSLPVELPMIKIKYTGCAEWDDLTQMQTHRLENQSLKIKAKMFSSMCTPLFSTAVESNQRHYMTLFIGNVHIRESLWYVDASSSIYFDYIRVFSSVHKRTKRNKIEQI